MSQFLNCPLQANPGWLATLGSVAKCLKHRKNLLLVYCLVFGDSLLHHVIVGFSRGISTPMQ